MAINPLTGLEEEETFTTPGLGVIQDIKEEEPVTALEVKTELPPATVATEDSPIVNRGIVAPIESKTATAPITDDIGAAIDIRTTKIGEVLTDEEKLELTRAERERIRNLEGVSFEDRQKEFREFKEKLDTGEFFGGETQVEMERQRAAEQERRLKAEAGEAITSAEELFAQELETNISRIREQGQQVMDTTQRLNSLRGGGRSSANIAAIQEQQGQITDLISASQKDSDIRLQLRKAEIEGAEAKAITAIKESLAANEEVLNQRIEEATKKQAALDAQLGSTFTESANALVGLLAASGVEVGDYDDKASKALGYISDSKGVPLKLDADGNPVAPKNEFGMDTKISNFKDANDNTYVYTNGELTSIIDNQGNILKGDQLTTVKVPAQIEEDKTNAERRKTETSLRNEFIKRPEVKRFQEIKAQFERVKQGADANNASGDIALVFSFMKMLDPASVVRESEFATAQNAAGVPDQMRNLYNKVLSGTKLGSDQRQEFKTTAENLLKSEVENFETVKEGFRGIIEDAGGRFDFVILDEFEAPEAPVIELDEAETNELDSIFGTTEGVGAGTFTTIGGKEFKLDFKTPDQTGGTKAKGILGDLEAQILPKGGDNPVLGLKGGSLTFRTNNPLAITATQSGTADRLAKKFGALSNIFSPDSADNLVLNFKTPEEGLRAGRQLLESKGNLTIDKLMESHTGTAATGHKAQAKKLGLNLNTKFKDLSEEDKNKVIEAIKIGEGFKAGTTLNT